jgi:hypothetical protein
MIQRPQTLYYLAIVAISLMLLFSNTVYYTAESSTSAERFLVEYDETEIIGEDASSKEANVFMAMFIIANGFLALVALILFKNRKLQTLLSGINYLFILGLIVMMYMYSINMNYFEDGNSSFTFFASIPIAMLILNFFAIRGIKRDEQLIRSMDRLR